VVSHVGQMESMGRVEGANCCDAHIVGIVLTLAPGRGPEAAYPGENDRAGDAPPRWMIR
jgi:hypothetical protein